MKTKRRLLMVSVMVLTLGIFTVAASAAVNDTGGSKGSGGKYAAGEAIACVNTSARAASVEGTDLLKNTETLMDLDNTKAEGKATTFSAKSSQKLLLVKSDSLSTDEMIEELEKMPGVEFAEPNYVYHISGETPDYSQKQYAYDAPKYGAGHYGINVENWNTYDISGVPTPKVNAKGVVVAVLDTGVDYNHEDLKDVMWSSGKSYPALTKMGGGTYGFNSLTKETAGGSTSDSTEPMDDNSHGSHCAGIIGAQWNVKGISGAASGEKIMAVKAGNKDGIFYGSSIIKGYEYIKTAIESGVNVKAVNDSWGGTAGGSSVDIAVSEVGKAGAVSCFASGNDSKDCDVENQTVSGLKNNPYVVAVNASDKDGKAAYFTNYGASTTDVAAPGVDIYSTVPKSSTADVDDTENAKLVDKYDRNDINGIFNYIDSKKTGEEIKLEIAKDQGNADNALKATSLSNDPDDEGAFFITKGTEKVKKAKYLAFRYKIGANDKNIEMIAVTVDVKLTNGKWASDTKDNALIMPGSVNRWSIGTVKMPENTDWEDFTVKIYISGATAEFKGAAGVSVLFDDMTLTDMNRSYQYMSGTSMAAPAVTGEAAILAANFKDDKADKLAARIIGSVEPLKDNTAGKSISGGLASVEKALAEDTSPSPVVNSAKMDNSQLVIGGFFFGDKKGKVTIGGKEIDTAAWSDTEIKIDASENIDTGRNKVEVQTAGNESRAGHQYFDIDPDNDPNLYDRLTLPDAKDAKGFYNMAVYSVCALNNKLYCLGTNDDNGIDMWCYDTKNKEWSEKAGLSSDSMPLVKSTCTYEGRLVTVVINNKTADSMLASYDPDSNKWSIYATNSETPILMSGMIINNGEGLYYMGGQRLFTETMTTKPQKDIYRIDMKNRTFTKIGEIDTVRNEPAAAYTGGTDIYMAGGTDADGNIVDSLEKISFSGGKATSKVVKTGIMPSGISDKQDKTMTIGSVKGGMIMTGPVIKNDDGNTTADTYKMTFDNSAGFVKTGKLVSTGKLFNFAATAYDSKYYVLGTDAEGRIMAADSADTIEQPGQTKKTLKTPAIKKVSLGGKTGIYVNAKWKAVSGAEYYKVKVYKYSKKKWYYYKTKKTNISIKTKQGHRKYKIAVQAVGRNGFGETLSSAYSKKKALITRLSIPKIKYAGKGDYYREVRVKWQKNKKAGAYKVGLYSYKTKKWSYYKTKKTSIDIAYGLRGNKFKVKVKALKGDKSSYYTIKKSQKRVTL